jgi:hypothetical protein
VRRAGTLDRPRGRCKGGGRHVTGAHRVPPAPGPDSPWPRARL